MMSSKMVESQTISNPGVKKNSKFPANPTNYKIIDDFKGKEIGPKINLEKKEISKKIN